MKRINEVSDRSLVTFSGKRKIARRLQLIEGRKRHFYRSMKKGGLTRDRLFKSIFRITCPMVQLARRTLPKTSVSSEIEFCGIAPRLPRKISIKFHQVRRSSATTRWQRYTAEDEGARARSLASVYLSPIDLIRGWFALPARSICQRLSPAAFPKSRRPWELSGQCDPIGSDRSSAAAFLVAIKSSIESVAAPTWSTANKCSTRITVRDAVSTVVTKAE